MRDPRERTFAYPGEGHHGEGEVEERRGKIPKEAEEALKVVGRLAEDNRNEVWLLSGLSRSALEVIVQAWPNIGLV